MADPHDPTDPRDQGPDDGRPDTGEPAARPPRPRGFLRRFFGETEPVEWQQPDGDPHGIREYAEGRGWTVAAEDAEASRLLTTLPGHPGPKYHAGNVIRGRTDPAADSLAAALADSSDSGYAVVDALAPSDQPVWDFLAFEVLYDDGRWRDVHSCVTALPSLVRLPQLRLSPSRFPLRRAGGMLVIPSGDPEFDQRWRLLSTEDSAIVRALVGPTVRAALLSGQDLDEIWTAEDHVLVSRADGHTPTTLRWHLALLSAVLEDLRQTLGQE